MAVQTDATTPPLPASQPKPDTLATVTYEGRTYEVYGKNQDGSALDSTQIDALKNLFKSRVKTQLLTALVTDTATRQGYSDLTQVTLSQDKILCDSLPELPTTTPLADATKSEISTAITTYNNAIEKAKQARATLDALPDPDSFNYEEALKSVPAEYLIQETMFNDMNNTAIRERLANFLSTDEITQLFGERDLATERDAVLTALKTAYIEKARTALGGDSSAISEEVLLQCAEFENAVNQAALSDAFKNAALKALSGEDPTGALPANANELQQALLYKAQAKLQETDTYHSKGWAYAPALLLQKQTRLKAEIENQKANTGMTDDELQVASSLNATVNTIRDLWDRLFTDLSTGQRATLPPPSQQSGADDLILNLREAEETSPPEITPPVEPVVAVAGTLGIPLSQDEEALLTSLQGFDNITVPDGSLSIHEINVRYSTSFAHNDQIAPTDYLRYFAQKLLNVQGEHADEAHAFVPDKDVSQFTVNQLRQVLLQARAHPPEAVAPST